MAINLLSMTYYKYNIASKSIQIPFCSSAVLFNTNLITAFFYSYVCYAI